MATQLPTTYLDPILDTSVNAKKLFKLTNQTTKEEMTVTIEDITTYLQIASTIGAGAFNTQNQVINSKLTADTLVGKLAEVLALTQPGSVADALVLKEMNANFQAGCSTIASAITANGVSTASNASPATMSTNIGNIRSGGTLDAAGNQLLAGYTAITQKVLRGGSMPNRGSWSATINPGGNITIPAGYHNGVGTVTANGTSLKTVPWSVSYNSGSSGTVNINVGTGYAFIYVGMSNCYYVEFGGSVSHTYNSASGVVTVTFNGQRADSSHVTGGSGYIVCTKY